MLVNNVDVDLPYIGIGKKNLALPDNIFIIKGILIILILILILI